MNCPKCQSTYTELSEKKETVNEITYEYKCLACGHIFKTTNKKSKPAGKMIMTIYGDETWGEYKELAEILETSNGTLYSKQKTTRYGGATEFVDTTVVPKFKVVKYTFGYSLQYDSFSYFNDKKGTLITVHKIDLNDELANLAKKSEAMQIALKGNFLKKSQQSSVVLDDVARWLNNALAPYKSVSNSASSSSSSNSKDGCYVATAVYGSYDCPHVWTLRRFRDETLAATWYGRAFIRTYYAISPTLVKWFGKTAWFRNLWKPALDKMVSKLQKQGVADTPYQDRNW